MKFGDLLRQLREQAGLTQQQLADKSGTPIGSLRGYEQGQRIPAWPAVVKLAKTIGVPTDAFSECEEAIEAEPEPVPPKRKGKK